MTHLVLRRFVGLTPYNAVDRIRFRREQAEPKRLRPCARWFHYGPITWIDLYRALRSWPPAYRAGDATRRQRR